MTSSPTPDHTSDDELRRLCDAATPGPWGVKNADVLDNEGRAIAVVQDWDDERELCDNADFIAAARTAVPSLLDRLAAAEREAAELRRIVAIYREDVPEFCAGSIETGPGRLDLCVLPVEHDGACFFDSAAAPVSPQPEPRRYDQCDETCTTDCGHCKGQGPPQPEPPTEETKMHGAELIAVERQRQIDAEGYSAQHDAGHADPEHFAGSDLREAALCYLHWGHATHGLPGEPRSSLRAPARWPWSEADWKPSPENQVRDLVKAGALIAAEIDRLTRGGSVDD